MQNSAIIRFFKSYFFWGFALIFLVLNSLKLESSSMYLDEAYSLFYAQQDFSGLTSIFEKEANPPLYFVTLYGWVHVFGATVFSGRLLSLIFSTILLIVVGNWLNKRFGVLSSTLFCLMYVSNPMVIDMSMEIRTFSLTALLITLAVLSFIKFHTHKAVIPFFVFAGCSLLSLYSHLNAVFPIALLGILLLLSPVKAIFKFGFATILTLGTFPLLLLLTDAKLSSTSGWMTIPGWDSVKMEFFLLGSNWIFVILFLLSTIGTFLFLKLKKPENPYLWIVFLTLAAGSWFASFMVSQSIPVFRAKYLYFSIVFFLVLVGLLVQYLSRNLEPQFKGIILLVFTVTFLSGMFSSPHKSEDWKGAVNYISSIKTDDHMVIVSPVYMYRPFSYYFDYTTFSSGKDPVKELYPKDIVFLKQMDAGLFDHINPKKVIYVSSHQEVVDPNWNNVQLLNERYTYLSDSSFAGIQVFRFEEHD